VKNRDIKYLTQDQVKSLFAVIKDPKHKALFLLAYRHGLRVSEVSILQDKDIDFERNKIMVHRLKGSISGEQLLTPAEVKALRKWFKIKPNVPYLFVSRMKTPITRQGLDFLMKKYCKAAGIPRDKSHFHALKHSIAVHLLDSEMDIMAIQDWLGHRCIESTLVYAKITGKRRDKLQSKILHASEVVGG
jgi:site-specific recombinase XerD